MSSPSRHIPVLCPPNLQPDVRRGTLNHCHHHPSLHPITPLVTPIVCPLEHPAALAPCTNVINALHLGAIEHHNRIQAQHAHLLHLLHHQQSSHYLPK